MALADLDSDGDPDLLGDVGLFLWIAWNNGDGTLTRPVAFDPDDQDSSEVYPESALPMDVDGDGDTDVVRTFSAYEWVSSDEMISRPFVVIMSNLGDGTFSRGAEYVPPGFDWLTSISSWDLDGDGDLDLLVHITGGRGILMNDGSGQFGDARLFLPHEYGSVAGGDLDGDGTPELAVSNLAGVRVAINNGDGTFQLRDIVPLPTLPLPDCLDFDIRVSGDVMPASYDMIPAPLTTGDFDGDGRPDLAVSGRGGTHVTTDSRLRFFLLFGANEWRTVDAEYEVGGAIEFIAAGDFDNDGWDDLAVTDPVLRKVWVLRNDGDGSFRRPVGFAIDGVPHLIKTADMDSDGDLDLVTYNDFPLSVSILLNQSSETFEGDCNGDGVPDGQQTELDEDGNSVIDDCECRPGVCREYPPADTPCPSPQCGFGLCGAVGPALVLMLLSLTIRRRRATARG